MIEIIKTFYRTKHIKTIDTLTIQQALPGNVEYEVFAKAIKELEAEEILKPVLKNGINHKSISIYNTYRINIIAIKSQLVMEIQAFQKQANSCINLESYVRASEVVWNKELPWLKRLDSYLKKKGLPDQEATSSERSYEIMQDEKWIDEKGGRNFLERLGLIEAMRISAHPDPLMLAVNYKAWEDAEREKKVHKHLIVENKSTYYLFLEGLRKTNFTSLIYGCGWKISAGLEGVYQQLGLSPDKCRFYYFGDLDYEGMAIYEAISKRVELATIFYNALLEMDSAKGKENQERREEVLKTFSGRFKEPNCSKIKTLLEAGYYYPQEALSKEASLKLWQTL